MLIYSHLHSTYIKITDITPVLKKGEEKNRKESYWLVNILPNILKTFEKRLVRQISISMEPYFEKNNVASERDIALSIAL